MAIRTPRELAIRLKANAIDCEIIAGKDLPSAQRARLLKMAEHYWQMADRIDQPRVRPGSLTEAFRLARTARCGGYPDEATG
jgi:type IV pilus biogenesis protein CpaD/CtpE